MNNYTRISNIFENVNVCFVCKKSPQCNLCSREGTLTITCIDCEIVELAFDIESAIVRWNAANPVTGV